MFAEYENYLKYDFSPDFWSDEGLNIACTLLGKFSTSDWQRLSEIWVTQASDWKVRCAETLDANLTDEGAAILLSMLNEADVDIVVAVVDSLRSWPPASIRLSNAHVEQIVRVQHKTGSVGKAVLTSFLAGLEE